MFDNSYLAVGHADKVAIFDINRDFKIFKYLKDSEN